MLQSNTSGGKSSPNILIKQVYVVLSNKVSKADVLVNQGKIAEIADFITESEDDVIIQAEGRYLLPGFIDIHNHGARGFDISLGAYQAEEDTFIRTSDSFEEGFSEALVFYLRHGVTRVFPTSLAASIEDLTWSFQALDYYLKYSGNEIAGLVGGINLEGTFLKLPEYAGAQNPEFFYPADLEVFEKLNKASGRRIKIVNLPPEHGKKGLALTRLLKKEGIVVAGGHTGAEADQFSEAVEAGLQLGVHFFNGPSRSSSKSFHDGGAEEAMLRLDDVMLELIVDGYHVHPAYVRDTLVRKEPSRIILITDSMFVNGCEDFDHFSLSGIPGSVSENREYLQVTNKEDTLFGSVLHSKKGFENVLNWLTREMTGIWYRKHDAYSLEDALVMVSQMASGNPARLLRLDNPVVETDVATGSIKTGFCADLLLVTLEENEKGYELKLEKIWLKGKEIIAVKC